MKEYAYVITEFKEAHIVDDELLQCLQKAFYDEGNVSSIDIIVNCNDGMQYDFTEVLEFIQFVEERQLSIDELEMGYSYRLEDSYDRNSTNITFYNADRSFFESACDIKYQYNNEQSFFYMKNKVETLIKNKKPSYSIMTRLPLIWVIVFIGYLALCLYTWVNEIVFPQFVQDLITLSSCLLLIGAQLPFVRKVKQYLFPKSDYRFGLLKTSSIKKENIRSFIFKGIIVSVCVSILANCLSVQFFQ